jgi:60 kDa SS-A/Ro ribonucleoprotein
MSIFVSERSFIFVGYHRFHLRRIQMSSKIYTQTATEMNPAKAVTPQSQAIPGREAEMAKNNAGGFTFTLDSWGVLDRFLMLGSETNGYYVGAKEKTAQSFDTVISCIKADGLRVVARILEYSLEGRAPKNDPAVVALALTAVYGNAEAVQAAYDALPKVARTGTWLFQFVSILDSLGKWNAAAKRGVAKWYTSKTIDRLAVQLLKYQSRNGWAHRDVLRLAHVKPQNELQSALLRYSVKGAEGIEQGTQMPKLVIDFETLKRTTSKKEVLSIITDNADITWEMVPTSFLADADVLLALAQNMGLTAVIRKLGVLTARGVISPMSAGAKLITSKLSDVEALRKQRVHPITLLQALKQYQKGAGDKGSLTWKPNQRVIDSLNDAFYASFKTIEMQDESYLLGVDCSGSMFSYDVAGAPGLVSAEVAGVMALAIAKNVSNYWIGGFNTRMGELKISPNMRLDTVLEVIRRFNWGGTDCALPMLHAAQNHMNVDKFITITDNETWAGRVQPVQALRDYRAKFNAKAKCVVIGTSTSEFTIADPKDAGMLDIAGFDSAAPQLIAQL